MDRKLLLLTYSTNNQSKDEETPVPNQSHPHLKPKIHDWTSWAYTDGSCFVLDGKQVIGGGVYQPSTKTIILVEPNGQSITNTIGRAELASIAAALTHGYTHIAKDSLTSLHQIRKQLLYPEKHRNYVQSDILNKIANILHNSPTHICL